MQAEALTIRQLLDQELERRLYVSGMQLTVEELFEKEKAMQWIGKLIGRTHSDSLKALMDQTSGVRLGHAAATYLLGVAVRDRLRIPFDLLPRFITGGSGDGFQFFWALVCLCHDLGYYFEHTFKNNKSETDKMNTPEQRKQLFRIRYDLLELPEEELQEICSVLGAEYCRWISDARRLIGRYDGYRRKILDPEPEGFGIDHGVAGAMLLYDLLRKEYDRMLEEIRSGEEGARALGGDAKGVLDSVSDESSAKRFLACSLWIACTVGRHNMWVAGSQEDNELYGRYNLDGLYFGEEKSFVRADSNLEQMLFLLDFLDTIDPVKGIYLRPCEDAELNGTLELKEDELNRRRAFLLDCVKIRFVGDYTSEMGMKCRWGNALTYRKIEVFAEEFSEEEQKKYFDDYIGRTLDLNGWLKTKKPEDERENHKATYYIPAHRSRGNVWRYGITNDEVDALLLYEGCGVPGKYGVFYSPAEAYQTFNLLMMPGSEGEKVRVLEESQKPRSFYITHWAKMLDVMLDIFTAQCKYATGADPKQQKLAGPLYRSDRRVNVELMRKKRGTFAFTSTSLGNFKTKFLVDKREPRILVIRLGEKVPYFDYEGFFGSQYIFSSEREVLLPPLLKMEMADQYNRTVEGKGPYPCYEVHVTGFDLKRAEQGEMDEYEQIKILEKYAVQAAAALERMTAAEDDPCTDILDDEKHPYRMWKDAFQKLTLRCMGNIYKRYFGIN